jgi:hypothetical protein
MSPTDKFPRFDYAVRRIVQRALTLPQRARLTLKNGKERSVIIILPTLYNFDCCIDSRSMCTICLSCRFESSRLKTTPTKPWSPAWRVVLAGPAPFQLPLPGSKRAATANETANRYSIAAGDGAKRTRTRPSELRFSSPFCGQGDR